MKKSIRELDAISGTDRKKSSRFGNLGCALFSLPFFLGGVAVIYFLGVSPLLKVVRAANWHATPCVITSSKVASSSDGDTYAVEIRYAYTVNGQQHQGTRYSFFSGYTSGYSGKSEVVQQNPAGIVATCYVNPTDPSEAVFYRGYSFDMLWGLFGVPFLLVGVGGLYVSFKSVIQRKKTPKLVTAPGATQWPTFDAMRAPTTLTTTQGGVPLHSTPPSVSPSLQVTSGSLGRVVLEPATTPLKRLLITLFIALFWNGVVSVFIVVLINQWRHGNFEWFLALFLTPFVLIGLFLLFSVFHSFLGLFNPRPRLTLHSGQLCLGDAADLEWEFSGSIGRIKQLRIYLEGREEATYRRGTDTLTDKNAFSTIEIVNKLSAEPGRARVNIPSTTMHSFKSDHNKIVWEINVKGKINFWSDVTESFELEVFPKRSLINAAL